MPDFTIDLSAMSPMGRRRVCAAISELAHIEANRITDDLQSYPEGSSAGKEMHAWRDGAIAVQKRAFVIHRES